MTLKHLCIYICGCLLLMGCNFGTYFIKTDEEIPKKEREQIQPMMDSIFNCITEHHYDYLKKISSPEVLEKLSDFVDNDEWLKNLNFPQQQVHESYAQFFVQSSAPNNITINVTSKVKDFNLYTNVETGYNYVYLMPIKLSDNRSIFMIECSFHRKSFDKWQLIGLYLSMYSLNGKAAMDHYFLAQAKYDLGKYLEAYYLTCLAGNEMTPGGVGFHYLKEKEVIALKTKIADTLKAKNTASFAIPEIKTHPKITNISTTYLRSALYTTIYCESSINFTDTIALKKEGMEITRFMVNFIPEISETSDSIIYQFSNQPANNLGYSAKYTFTTPSKL